MNSKLDNRILSIDYLRGFLTILVVLHHALLAYTSQGTASLIVDHNKFPFFDNVVVFQDLYFMFLFFFLSGVHTFKNIDKYGVLRFLKNRFMRLGIPFLLGWLIINIPGYYLSTKAYVVFILNNDLSIPQYFQYWLTEQKMATAGPLWFIWVLLVFDTISCLFCYFLIKRNIPKLNINTTKKTLLVFLISFGLCCICYALSTRIYSNNFITLWGPFSAQLNRIPLYFIFFITGALFGPESFTNGVFNKNSSLSKIWWLTGILGILSWRALYTPQLYSPGLFKYILLTTIFVLTVFLISLTLISIFARYVTKENIFLSSLSKNAYGIYIFHYSIVALFQYIFLHLNISGFIKGIIVFTLSLFLAWLLTKLTKKLSIINKII